MTELEKLTMLKSMSGYDESESVLSTYLKIAGSKILRKAYPFDNTIQTVPPEYEVLQCEIALFLLNKRGAEGQTAHSENGVSRTYESADIPASMLRNVIPNCGVLK